MSNSCTFIPKAKNGKDSILFQDLQSHLHNRAASKRIWGFTQTKLFQDEFTDIEKDENGEPTYPAVAEILNLDNIFKRSEKDANRALDMGLVDRAGRPTTFPTASSALARAKVYNDESSTRVALVHENEDGDGFHIDVEESTPLAVAEADINEARRNVNKELINLLHRLGFDLEFADDPSLDSSFNPLNAEENANGLKVIIRIKNGEQGLEDISEEICHVLIAGLENNPLKQRLDAVFTDEVVRRVLGDQYDRYKKKYSKYKKSVDDVLREEAEGKALARLLKGQPIEAAKKAESLLRRIWNHILSLFNKATIADVDNCIVNAQDGLASIADRIRSGEIEQMLDKDEIAVHEQLFSLVDKTEKAYEVAQDGETMLSHRLAIEESSVSSEDPKKLRQSIIKTRKAISDGQYALAIYDIMREIGRDVTSLIKESQKLGSVYAGTNNLNLIAAEASLVRRMTTATQAYKEYLALIVTLPKLVERGEINLDKGWAEQLSDMGAQYMSTINAFEKELGSKRFHVLKQLISLYYGINGSKPESFSETDKVKWESIDTLLNVAKHDIPFWDGGLFSAGASRNPLLNVVHNIVVRQQAKRNTIIRKHMAAMQEADAKLHAAGYESNFIYEYDENGKPTGFYKSNRDWVRYEKERQAFIDSISDDENDEYDKLALIHKWDEEHLEDVEVGEPLTPGGPRRKEKMPALKYYEIKDFDAGWSDEQKEYYKTVIAEKAEMDAMLPVAYQHLYHAPQVRKSVSQMFDKDGPGALKTIWSNWKKRFSITDDNEDYSKNVLSKDEDGKVYTLLDFAQKKVKRVPVYYTHRLENMEDLSTDGTRAIVNYVAMAVNYSEMNQLSQAMRLLQEHVETQYEVEQWEGDKPVYGMFRALKRKYLARYTEAGTRTKSAQAITTYIDRMFYNDTKNKAGTLKIGKLKINLDSLYNVILMCTSWSRMGLNPLSGITNITQGETQMIEEAIAARYFNLADLAWTKKEYFSLLMPYMGQFNSADRHDKMYLLINTFNSSEDFFRDMKDRDFNKSAYKRVLGRGNIYFLNTMGEHYLHTSGMLAVLKHEKVIRKSDKSRKEISLYDALTIVHDNKGYRIELDDDIEFVDKNKSFLLNFNFGDKPAVVTKADQDQLFENLSVYINTINADMHGGYSEAEKGNMNRHFLARAVTQFRQWMFGMYNKLYSRPYFDATSNTMKEGGYYTIWKFISGTVMDMQSMSLKMAVEKNKLSHDEMSNAKVALAQAGLFVLMKIFNILTSGWKDEDDAKLRLLAYSMRRLEMETGALVPFPPTFIKNVFTLIQSPAAGIKTLETVSQLMDLTMFFQEVQSGRFKGWNRGVKALWTLTPLYNIQRLIDMDDYSYMFNIFN